MDDAKDRQDGSSADPQPPADSTAGPERPSDAAPVSTISPDAGAPPADGAPSRDEMSVAFTPAQLAVGGAVVAGLLVVGVRLLLGRRRGRG